MTIKQLLEMPADKEKSKCGGFQLTVKTARKNRKVDGKTVQQVVLSDSSGEIPGDIFLPNPKQCSYLPRATVINVLVCWLQPGEDGPKLYIDEWFFPKTDGEGNPVYRNGVRGYGDLPPDFSSEREDEPVVRSMIRHGIVTAHRRKVGLDKKLTVEQMEIALADEEFIYAGIMTGESDG